MVDINVRVLGEADWQVYRDLRLEALRESPDAFVSSYDEESRYDDDHWQEQLRGNRLLIAERNGTPVGVMGLGVNAEDDEVGEVLGLWVDPQARRDRVAAGLVGAAVEQAVDQGRKRLYFWVGSDNGAAVAFASTIGFRPTSERRPAGAGDEAGADDEVAMMLALSADPGSVANPRIP